MASGVKVKFKPNRAAPREVLNSAEALDAVERATARVHAAADSMGSAAYAHDVRPGRNRAHGIVYTPSEHAIRSNAKHNSLLKALHGGGR